MLDRLCWPLMLMQQGDSADERQILRVVAPRPRLAVQERKPRRIGIDDGNRLQEPLRIAMQAQQVVSISTPQQPLDGLRLTLHTMDGLCLRLLLIHRQDKT